VLPYEHILTWDYETFGTSVERTGAELAAALRQRCGLGRDDGLTLHVYAHSMGTLVSRSLVECAGGHDFVDRMVLAGPPNRGTTLASMSRGMTYLLAALLNGLGELPVAGAASWALKQLYEHGHGWEDLETDSELTRRINELETPNNVRYLVLAGDNTRNQCQGARLARLAHKLLDRGLDTVFGERENDAVVPMSSMLGLRNGSYPLLESRVLPCDHFTYFALPEGRAAIREWVPRA
jgi:pimeloyl-ACP methyl ester carboxylesterase